MAAEQRTVDLGVIPVADTFASRLRGLLGRDSETIGRGLFFPRCRSVHTVGMRVPIDVVFLDGSSAVVSVRDRLRPYRFASGGRAAAGTLELPAGWAERLQIAPGCRVTWRAI